MGKKKIRARCREENGFTLVEALIAIVILTFGLLAAGQLIFIAASSASLSRSKDSASIAAQNKLESLADLFNRDPNAGDLSIGVHGPDQVQVLNQATNTILNRYAVSWAVTTVADPRPGKVLKAKQVSVTVTPVTASGNQHLRVALNKIVRVSAILSMRTSS